MRCEALGECIINIMKHLAGIIKHYARCMADVMNAVKNLAKEAGLVKLTRGIMNVIKHQADI